MRQNSWAVCFEKEESGVTIFAGSGVEKAPGWVVEGAWDDAFSESGLMAASFRAGSGAIFDSDRIQLFCPSHSLEGVFVFISSDSLWVANSMHLIVAKAKGAAPRQLDKVRDSVRTATRGKAEYSRKLYETETGTMFRLLFGVVDIDRHTCEMFERTDPDEIISINDFASYDKLLVGTVGRIVANARDTERSSPYRELITTCSSGYDSAACAAVAKRLGATRALTIRSGRGGSIDSGRHVAEALGLECREFERFGTSIEALGEGSKLQWLDASVTLPEHREFMASVGTSEDLYFAPFEPFLERAILLTGFHGDKVWSAGCASGPNLVRGDSSGSGLDVFRHRVGFINVPVPFIGAADHEGLANLFNAEEMKPWRIKSSYDRPLPRRLAESAGVPRDAFGRKKTAASVLLKHGHTIRNEAFHAVVREYALKDSEG